MAAKSSNQEIVYEEFEPFCKWQRKDDRDVLEIQLQGKYLRNFLTSTFSFLRCIDLSPSRD